jgi:phosphate starvation-inducible protein PhoH
MILTGDLEQCDIEGGNGLEDFVWRLKNTKKQAHTIQIVEMTKSDIMRSDIVKDVLYIYDSTEASFYFASHC